MSTNEDGRAHPDRGAGESDARGDARGDARSLHFIEQIVEQHNASGRWGTWRAEDVRAGGAQRVGAPRVHTRFPPEPNGYLHVGHAKSINLNFGLAVRHGGKFNLRFDDTNPAKEEREYVDSITRDVRWLGADFEGPSGGGIFYASDYFGAMYDFAVELVKKGKAYVCDLPAEEVSRLRGTPQVPAQSPFRERSVQENLALLERMRAGEFPNGARTLRAKIDLASPNFNLRDPVMYRIVHEEHHNTGSAWCLYPMYDWAHGIEDSLEGITHSICTLEFEDHRPLYNWFIDAINVGRTDDGSGPWGKKIHHPQQIEFAKLRPTGVVMSKRNLLKMVESGIVDGWDDPRMPTISGMRRRGYTPEAIRAFCDDVGVTKVESSIDSVRLENAARDHLNKVAPRAMGVLRPLRVSLTNWPKDASGQPVVEMLDFAINPEDPGAGTRKVAFAGEIFIEREDFREAADKGFFRLAVGQEVRLRWAYFITANSVQKDASGAVTRVLATYDPATRGGDAPVGPDGKPSRKVKGTLHWVSAPHARDATVRLIERLFTADTPGERTGNWMDDLNPRSMETLTAKVEPWLAESARFGRTIENGCPVGDRFQLERLGYFCVDRTSSPELGGAGQGGSGLVLLRTVTLKDDRPDAGAKKPPSVRTYSIAEAAHELKLKQEKLREAISAMGMAGFASRTPEHLTLDEVRALKEWLKTHAKELK